MPDKPSKNRKKEKPHKKRKLKGSIDYFAAFEDQVSFALQEAGLLRSILANFSSDEVKSHLEEAHAIENGADCVTRKILSAASSDFITPINREDIIELALELDDVTDSFERILRSLYMYGATTIDPPASAMCSLLFEEVELLKEAMSDFHNFKKPKKLKEKALEIDELEGKVDKLHTDAMHELFTSRRAGKDLIRWQALYTIIEDASDAIESCCDLMKKIVISNV